MFFVAVGTNHQPNNLKCGGCTWYQPAEIYGTYVMFQIRIYLVSAGYPDTYVPGISRQTNVPPVDAHV